MRIAMVSEHADPLAAVGGVDSGGQNVHVAQLARALAARGHSVVVHTRRSSTRPPDRVPLYPGVEVDYVSAGPAAPVPKDELAPYMPAFARVLRRRWQRDTPDVVHAHFWMSGQAALMATTRIPVVQTFHALGAVKRRWQGGADTSPADRIAAEREIGDRADTIVATAGDEVRELLAMGIAGSKITVIPCGVDLEHFTPVRDLPGEGDHWWTRPRGGGRLLSIGRLVPRKGVDNVIRALHRIPGAELVIAGGAEQDEESVRLRELAGHYGVADRVRLLGSVPRAHVPALMRSADVVVSVPWYEPFGIVSVEAMACGVPVVASAVGGHLDTVAGSGVLVPPRRPRALAKAVCALLADPRGRGAIGGAGARRARRLYGWPHIAEQTEAVYERAISGRTRRLELLGG